MKRPKAALITVFLDATSTILINTLNCEKTVQSMQLSLFFLSAVSSMHVPAENILCAVQCSYPLINDSRQPVGTTQTPRGCHSKQYNVII